MSTRTNPKIFIRRPSNQSADHMDSLVSHANITGRTVSSGSNSSMMSTPSNNIRRIQEQRQQQQQLMKTSQNHQKMGKPKKTPKAPFSNARTSNTNVKYKLLNLQKSSKRYASSEHAGRALENLIASNINQTIESIHVHKSAKERKEYDYSVFIRRDSELLDDNNHESAMEHPRPGDKLETHMLNAPVKQSQIDAWESAEKVTKNLIFMDSSDDEEDDELESASSLLGHGKKDIIKSIPGYTDGELSFVLSRYNLHLQRSTKLNQHLAMSDFDRLEEEEEKMLWEYRQRHQVSQERIFAQYLSISDKRKVQVGQKKELLQRIFGSSNNLNHSFITNNTSYSIMENISNSQLTFQEDEEEISQILEVHDYFQKVLEETLALIKSAKNHSLSANVSHNRRKLNNSRKMSNGAGLLGEDLDHFSNEKFQSVVAGQLDRLYGNYIKSVEQENGQANSGNRATVSYDNDDGHENDDDIAGREELQNFSLAFLRKCVKEDIDEENDVDGDH